GEHAAAGVEGEREQEDDDQSERQHLVQRHARPGLDSQVLARDEHCLPPQVHPARTSSSSVVASTACERGGSATPKWAPPPARTTSRPARARVRPSSWEARITVRSSSGAGPTTASST